MELAESTSQSVNPSESHTNKPPQISVERQPSILKNGDDSREKSDNVKERRLSFSSEALAKEPKGKPKKVKAFLDTEEKLSGENDELSDQDLTELAINVQDEINRLAKSKKGNKPKFRKVFASFDTDGSKDIDEDEFWSGLESIGFVDKQLKNSTKKNFTLGFTALPHAPGFR